MKRYLTLIFMLLHQSYLFGDYCWVQKSNVSSINRYASMGFSINGKGYVGLGFSNGVAVNDLWEYDPVTDVWTQKANYPVGGMWAGAAFALNGKGYFTVGFNGSSYPTSTYSYDPITNSWTQKASFPTTGRQDVFGFAANNYGYVVGGYSGGNYYNALYRYDPIADTWLVQASIPGSAADGLRGFVIGNIAYTVGGYNSGVSSNDVYAYNTLTNSWSSKAPIPGPARHSICAFEMNGKGFAGNGRDNIYFNDFYEYDPVLDSWSAIPNFPGLTLGYPVCFTVNNGGYISTGKFSTSTNSNQTWLLSQSPTASFATNSTSCELTVNFINNSTGATIYNWNFGDGSTSSTINPTYTYSSPGTYTVTLIASNGTCTDTVITTLTVSSSLNSQFTVTANCNQEVTVQNNTSGSTTNIWIWGDGNTDSTSVSSHVYTTPGNYTIGLLVSNGICSDTSYQTLYVDTFPVALISQTYSQCHDSVFLTSVNNSTSYLWNFGDGQSSNLNSISHYYVQPGIYTISLINTNNYCSDTSEVVVTTVDLPSADFTYSSGCDGSFNAVSASNPNWTYQWNTGDGNNFTTSSISHQYQVPGIYTAQLTVDNGYCLSTDSVSLIFSEQNTFQSEVTIDTCTRQVNFTLIPNPTTTIQWDFGDGNFSSSNNVIHTYEFPAIYIVTAITNPGSICSDTTEIIIDLSNAPSESIFIPNAFTPNGDNLNDVFKLNSNLCSFESVAIYDRWGLLIFSSNDINFQWNGNKNGVQLPDGVYITLVKVGKKSYKGALHLLR